MSGGEYGSVSSSSEGESTGMGKETANVPKDLATLVGEHFNCLICLELVHKPVVHACGHLFCFWCVHRTMNAYAESHCPLCRRPFIHFPRVCEQLHSFLQKTVPLEYSLRAKEVLEDEKASGLFSPDLNVVHPPTDNLVLPQRERLQNLEEDDAPSERTQASVINSPGTSNHASVQDLLCGYCKKLLYEPLVLNCGHVFCQICTMHFGNGLRCPTCQRSHPSHVALVCLELHQFMEHALPLEYIKRKEEVQASRDQGTLSSEGNVKIGNVESGEDSYYQGIVHVGAGCDGCGMMPIVGQRFQCQDCPEDIGFDLCMDCYQTDPYQIGRFNQKHTSVHRIKELVPSAWMTFRIV
eukprot:c25394_g1_i2 orf=275-1333(+)